MSSCRHEPFEQRTTLHVETNGSQVRIRCVACDRYVMVSRNGVLQTRSAQETAVARDDFAEERRKLDEMRKFEL